MTDRLIRVSTSTCSMVFEDGYWTVKAEMKEDRQEPNAPKATRIISAMSIDKNVDRAYKTALMSVTSKFESAGSDLFMLTEEECDKPIGNPFDSNETSQA